MISVIFQPQQTQSVSSGGFSTPTIHPSKKDIMMKKTSRFPLIVAAICLSLSAKAATPNLYDFTVSLPYLSGGSPLSGSIQLNTDNLRLSSSSYGDVYQWDDSVDVLTFNGVTYTGCSILVHNHDYDYDGFSIYTYSSSGLYLEAISKVDIIQTDTTLSDMQTVLNSFDMIKSGDAPYLVSNYSGQGLGTLISFEPASEVPEPSTWAMIGMGLPALLGAMRLRKRRA